MLDLSVLNPPQREAVLFGEGALLVLAGAGSGKTRVITYRIAKLLERGVPAGAICAVTFTNKAAAEMRERVAALVSKKHASALTISTFHALGLQILKAEKRALGFPGGFTIYDGSDQLGVVREALRSIRVDDRRFDSKAILHRISRAKNAFTTEIRGGTGEDEYDEIAALVFPKYQEALRAFAALDFDDLITETARILEKDAVRDRWAGRFSNVLVDEFQDTNQAQLVLLTRLAKKSVTVVGDDDQSIYGWRGAESKNILEFEKHFPGAKAIKLEQNYRSTPTILAAANAVIRNNRTRRDKTLFSDKHAGEKISEIASADADTEVKFVCDEIERLRIENKLRYSDCAILYRSNIQAQVLEEGLRARRIPFDMRGGQKFFDRKEIKDVIAYLKLALHPKDEISLRRIINLPARGIGPTTIERASAWAQEHRVPLWEALTLGTEIGISPKVASAVAQFVSLVEETRAELAGIATPVARKLIERIGLYADLRAAAPSMSSAQRRIDNVEGFLRSLDAHDQRAPGREALSGYLQLLSLNTSDDDDSDEAGNHVTLSTLHGAKGLEWPVVFLVGMEEELLPHGRTLYPHGPDVVGDVDVSEERRLAYVGITRAREKLYLLHARTRRKHGAEKLRTPSRFLQEIPSELLERRDLHAEAKAPVASDELRNFFRGFGEAS